ncbi:MAG TPA: L-threonylcarbamoyladenylate synthase [Blastocatellia bacterium]|nr:L-threonylcarbamoyladenylate synthase [Blastocatellia bacterium]
MRNTLVLQVDPGSPDPATIRRAASIIKSGGLVAFPTETVYGLGADACNETAVRCIFEAKGRPPDNPLIVHICDTAMLDLAAVDVPDAAWKLAERFWPGPLTLVLSRAERIAPSVSAGLQTVAVRMPANEIALELIRSAATPIAAPSANVSGRPSAVSAQHVLEDLNSKIDLVLDGGKTQIGIESTVLDLTATSPIILRPGWVTSECIAETIGDARFGISDDQLKRSPGTRHRHYTPRARVILVEDKNVETLLAILQRNLKDGPVAYIGHTPIDLPGQGSATSTAAPGSAPLANPNLTTIMLGNDPAEYGAAIYTAMRELDSRGVPVIVVEGISGSGEALAVMDRLRRSASRIV